MAKDTTIVFRRLVNGINYAYSQEASHIRTIGKEYQDATKGCTLVNIDFDNVRFPVAVVAYGERGKYNLWKEIENMVSLLTLYTPEGNKNFNPAFIIPSSICSGPASINGPRKPVTEFQLFPKQISGEMQGSSAITVFELKSLVLDALIDPSLTRKPKINLVVPYHNSFWSYEFPVELGSLLSIGEEKCFRDKKHGVRWRTASAHIRGEDEPLTILTYRDTPPHRFSTNRERRIFKLPPVLAERMEPRRPTADLSAKTTGQPMTECLPGEK